MQTSTIMSQIPPTFPGEMDLTSSRVSLEASLALLRHLYCLIGRMKTLKNSMSYSLSIRVISTSQPFFTASVLRAEAVSTRQETFSPFGSAIWALCIFRSFFVQALQAGEQCVTQSYELLNYAILQNELQG